MPPTPPPPGVAIVDVVAWICIQDKRLLCVRTQGKNAFYLPGGKREQGESDWQSTSREVKEEMSAELMAETFSEVITIVEEAHGYSAPTWVTMKCFQANYVGSLIPASEIAEMAWLSHAEKNQCAPATQRVIEHLFDLNLIE